MNGENPLKPKIDDQYWFELSDQLVRNTQQGPAEAAEKLQTFVQWLWGIYTGGAAIGLTLSPQSFSRVQLTLIALGSLALVVVYWFAVYVQLPVAVEFDPRSPTEIREAYKFGVSVKNRRLQWTILASALAAVLMTLGLVWDKIAPPANAIAPWFDLSLHVEGKNRALALTGEIGAAGTGGEISEPQKVIVKVQPAAFYGDMKPQIYALIPFGEHGRLQTSLPIHFNTDSLNVILEWKNAGGTTIRLSRMATHSELMPATVDTMQIEMR
jgi:hypothetical protein